ncbi:MAG TPA: hypothetical protein VFT95_19660, partial [Micromonosporaceae bacterium]|nr:hypothetical protein [Micromonosporaceae bacterium]
REAWSELTGAPRPRPPVQVVITYRLRFDDGDGSRIDTPVRPDLEDCSEEFGGEHWHSEPFGARFATPPLGWAHWYLTAGRYGWRRLEPLITKSVHRYPLNTLGGLLITAPDFSWVWHPYDGGSLVLNQAEQLP